MFDFFFLLHVCPESESLFCSFYFVRFLCETLRASLAFDIHLHLFAHIFFKVCSYSCITASGVLCAVCLVTTLSYFACLAFFLPRCKVKQQQQHRFLSFFPFSYLIIYNKLKGFFFSFLGGDGLISSLPQPISKQHHQICSALLRLCQSDVRFLLLCLLLFCLFTLNKQEI